MIISPFTRSPVTPHLYLPANAYDSRYGFKSRSGISR
jgi:hypothetical protein